MNILNPNFTLEKAKNSFGYLTPLPYFLEKNYNEEDMLSIIEGDLHLEELSLEHDKEGLPSTIIVKGDLIVEGLIWNSETDYGINLLVLGNLRAKNLASGGQLISIWGDLIIENILCGSYNHGEMYVAGNIHAKVMIADDYCISCGGEFNGLKIGDKGFYHVKTKTWFESDIIDTDMIFNEDVLDDHGFSFDKLLDCLMKDKSILADYPNVIQKEYDFESLIGPIINSSLIPEKHPYVTKLNAQNLEITKDSLLLDTEYEKTFEYSIKQGKILVKIVENNTIEDIKKSPHFITKKAFRLLKIAQIDFIKHEAKIEIRTKSITLFLNLLHKLLDPLQQQKLRERVLLAIQNPVLYVELYEEDCERRNDKTNSRKLYVSALIDEMVEQGIAVSINEKATLADARNALIALPKFFLDYNEGKLSQMKWGRKLFSFSNDMLIINEALPSNSSFVVRVFRNYPDEVVFFLIDRKPLLDSLLKQFLEDFEIK